jgi:hypothetical protein
VGQIGTNAAQACLNLITGNAVPVVSSTPPAAWIPGQYWVNTANSNLPYEYNGSAWVPASSSRYLALLVSDPSALPAVTIADLDEVTTAGYARAPVTMSLATPDYPSVSTDTGTITWGPMTADMLVPALFAALVTVPGGTLGLYLYSWPLPSPQQVSTSQYIQIATSALSLSQG